MDSPGGQMPQLPPSLKDRLDQINRLIDDLQRELGGITQDPLDDAYLPPLKKPANQYDLEDIQAYLNDRFTSPGGLRSRPGLRIQGVEMTQSIQFYDLYGQGSQAQSDNMIPLVAGKELILRAYVERRTGGMVAPPTQFDGIVRYRGKEVRSLNGPNPVQAATALRRNLIDDSLNFRIPAADCYGKVNFTVVAFDALNPTLPFNHTQYTVTAEFFEIPRMRITGVLFSFTGNSLNLAAPTGLALVNSLARFLPMLPTAGFDYNVCTVENFDKDLTVDASWDALLNRLATLRAASTIRTFYIGLLPANVTVLTGANLRGKGRLALTVSAQDDTRGLSHELGHACLFDHVDANSPPAPLDTKYPNYGTFPFGSIGEVGMDSARLTLYNPTGSYDFMTYWENGNPPPLFTTSTWISPYNYRRMMNFLKLTDGTADVSFVGTVVAVVVASFRVYRDGRVDINPSYTVKNAPYLRDPRPEADVMLDLYNRDGQVIGSYRCHQHNPYQDPEGAYLEFHEVLPRHESLAEIAVVRDRRELYRARVGEGAPQVRVERVRRHEDGGREGGDHDGDLARVEWSLDRGGESADSRTAALVRYSHDGGRTWQAVAADVTETRCLVNLDLLPGGDDCRFEVTAASGLASASAQSEPFAVRRKPRRAYIASPKNGDTFHVGEPVVFAGAGHSPDYGTSDPQEGTWTSSQAGLLGIGAYLVRSDLRPGTHRITLSTPDGRPDEHGGEAAATLWIKVVEAEC